MNHFTLIDTKYDTERGVHLWRYICTTCESKGEWHMTPKIARKEALAHEATD